MSSKEKSDEIYFKIRKDINETDNYVSLCTKSVLAVLFIIFTQIFGMKFFLCVKVINLFSKN